MRGVSISGSHLVAQLEVEIPNLDRDHGFERRDCVLARRGWIPPRLSAGTGLQA